MGDCGYIIKLGGGKKFAGERGDPLGYLLGVLGKPGRDKIGEEKRGL